MAAPLYFKFSALGCHLFSCDMPTRTYLSKFNSVAKILISAKPKWQMFVFSFHFRNRPKSACKIVNRKGKTSVAAS